MTLQEEIHADLKGAMLAKDENVKSLLRVLIGELNREGKIVDDAKVISIVRKMSENAKLLNNQTEVTILSDYLPQQLNEDEIRKIISAIIFANNYTIKDKGKIMADLKRLHSGQYDGKVASDSISSILG